MGCLALFVKALLDVFGGLLWFGWFILIPSQALLVTILVFDGISALTKRWGRWAGVLSYVIGTCLFLVWFAAFHATRLCYGFMVAQGEAAGGWGETIFVLVIIALIGMVADICIGLVLSSAGKL